MIIKDDMPQGPAVLLPGVTSSYSNGLNKIGTYFLELLLIIIIAFIIGIPSWIASSVTGTVDTFTIWDVFEFFYGILVSGPVGYGVAYAYLKAARRERPEIKDIFKFMENYWNVVIAAVLSGVIIVIGFILLIIPGVIFLCKLAFVPYLVVEKKMDAVAAIQESWRMTDGYAMTVFLVALLAIPIFIAGVMCFGVGVILSYMWVGLAMASLYHTVSSRGETPEKETTPEGPFL